MTRFCNRLLLIAMILMLAACGFQLRGMGNQPRQFPFTTLYIDSASPFGLQMISVIKTYPQVKLVSSAADADAVLRIISERPSKDISSIDRSGNINEYRLTYTVTAQLWMNGSQIGKDIVISQFRTMSYSTIDLLGKGSEEALIQSNLLSNAAQLMIYRLSSRQMLYASERAREASAPVSRVHHVITQP